MARTDFSGTNFGVDAPPYAVPPYTYVDNEMFTITVRTDPAVLRALVPEPLTPPDDDRLVLYIGMLNVVEPVKVTYGEAGIMIPVTYGDRPGSYLPAMYLTEIELLTSGREWWGFPKFEGDIALKREGHRVDASLKYKGTTLIGASMTFDAPAEKPPLYDREHFLLQSIPNVTGEGHDLRRLNTCLVRNDNRKETWKGTPDLSLGATPKHPMSDIPVLEVLNSVYSVGDLILDKGELLHDYLA